MNEQCRPGKKSGLSYLILSILSAKSSNLGSVYTMTVFRLA